MHVAQSTIMGRVPIWFACLALSCPAAAQQRRPVDSGVEPTSWGKVVGCVYDAATLMPLPGAMVSVRIDGSFADQGRSVAKTTIAGQYETRAPIGRVSENFDVGRALSSGIAGLILGGATNRTKRIDVVQLALRVRMEGYREFAGLVPCRRLDPGGFTVRLEPVLLAPSSGPDPSFTAPGWGLVGLDTVGVQPDVAQPGNSVVLRASVRAPRMVSSRDITVATQSAFWGTKTLKYVSGAEDGLLVYAITVRAPSGRTRRADDVAFAITASHLEVDPANTVRVAHSQVIHDPQDTDAARVRSSAWAAEMAGDHVAAMSLWRTVCQMPRADYRDFAALAASARRIHAASDAAAALDRAVQLAPEKERLRLMGRQADALRLAGSPTEVISRFGRLLQPEDRKQQQQDLPLPLLVALGESYMATGDLARAADVDARLMASPQVPDSSVRRFRAELRSAQAKAAIATNPNDLRARARYARLMLDDGRWEEAQPLLLAASAVAPSDAGVRQDLAYTMLRTADPTSAQDVVADEEAVRAARERTIVLEGGKPTKSKDFRAWHELALMLVARLTADRQAAAYRTQVEECRDVLRDALRCARSGARVSEGIYGGPLGYLSARTVGIAGYSYDEAEADFVIYESLGLLADQPGDGLASLAMGLALCGIGRSSVARHYAELAAAALPGDPEARYLAALVEHGAGRRADATRLLRDVVAVNPRHAGANLRLAELCAEDGDIALASRYLAAHASFYGTGIDAPRSPEPW